MNPLNPPLAPLGSSYATPVRTRKCEVASRPSPLRALNSYSPLGPQLLALPSPQLSSVILLLVQASRGDWRLYQRIAKSTGGRQTLFVDLSIADPIV